MLHAILVVSALHAASWGSPHRVSVDLASISFVRAGDLDGDGLADIVFTGSNDQSWSPMQRKVLLGHGLRQAEGGFQVSTSETGLVSGYRAFLGVSDIDADGDDDVIVGHAGGFSVYRGGAGGPVPDTLYEDTATSALTLGDVDGDGDPDLVTLSASLEAVIWNNDGTGVFTETARFPVDWSLSTDADYTDLLLRDLDGDGALDLLALLPWEYGTEHNLELHAGDGVGGFDPVAVPRVGQAPMGGPYRITPGDFNGDGGLELILGSNWESLLSMPWSATGPSAQITYDNLLSSPYSFDVADVDGDGDDDLLACDGFDLEMMVQGAGLSSAGTFHATDTATGTVSSWLSALADFDRDGCLDAVTVTFPGGLVVVPFVCSLPPEGDTGTADTASAPDEDSDVPAPEDTGGADKPLSTHDSGVCSTASGSGALGLLLAALALGARRRRVPSVV